MFHALARALLYPFRWNATHLPRGSFLRSASIPILKYASRRRGLLNSMRVIRPLDRRDISFVPADSMVMDATYWFGTQGYEGVLSELWPRLCAKSHCVVEIGANVGFYTVLGGKAAIGAYTVVEPLPEAAAILRRNLVLNKLERIEVIEAAAVPRSMDAPVQLNLPDEGREAAVGAHLVSEVTLARRSTKRVLDVAGVDICRLVKGCDLIKMDAEGAEHALLTAAMPIIERNAPTIVIEVLPESRLLAALLAEMAQRIGYTLYVIPSFRTEYPVAVPHASFTSRTPAMFQSKDVILSRDKL
ncbi:MAG: FkbM family methyltransferase [Rhodospirillaceae bacterium]|nr:FkbM family methyltransferase [Rhodospirillales bacterium]